MATTRRNFLKTSGVMAAGAALTGVPGLKTLEPAVGVDNPIEFYPTRDWEKIYRDQYRYDSTYTFICAPNDTHICRLRAFVRNGIIIRIEQDYEAEKVTDLYKNKISPAWNPRGCSKGYTFIRRIYGPYRAKYPMVRRGWREWAEAGFPMRSDGTPDPKYFRRSEDDWVRVSWDEASTFVAKGLTHIMDKYGGDKGADLLRDQGYPENMIAAMHGSGAQAIKIRPGMSLHGALRLQALKRFSNMLAFYDGKLGARSWSNYDWHGDLPPGHPMVTGVQTHDDDHNNFRHCRLFIMQGVNFVENKMADAHWWNEIMERGGKIVVIAPEYSASSTKADYWIPVRPGSDPALQLGVTQILLDEKLYDEAFVKKYTDMPLLVRLDTLKLLKASDIIPGYKNAELVGYSSTVQKIDPEMRERWGDFAVWDAKANRTVVVTREEYKKKKGEFTGGNKVAVGLVYNKETKKLEPDPVKKWIVLEAYQKKFEGETFADIGRGLNAKGARTRHGNPFTCAAVRYIFKSTQYVAAGLVSESDFIKASQYMSTRGSHRERAGREPALLRGLVYCECGTRTMSRSRSDNKRGKVYTFYECQKWAHHSKAGLCNGSRKMISAIKADYVIGNVVSEFFEEGKDKLIKKYKSFIDKLGNTADVKKLRAQLRQTEKAEHRLLTAYEGDAITLAQLKERNTANADQRQQLQTQLRILEENQSPPVAEFSQILDMFADFNNIEFAKQQACVNLLIQKITMHKESLEVTYRFAPPQTYPIPYMKQTRHIRH